MEPLGGTTSARRWLWITLSAVGAVTVGCVVLVVLVFAVGFGIYVFASQRQDQASAVAKAFCHDLKTQDYHAATMLFSSDPGARMVNRRSRSTPNKWIRQTDAF